MLSRFFAVMAFVVSAGWVLMSGSPVARELTGSERHVIRTGQGQCGTGTVGSNWVACKCNFHPTEMCSTCNGPYTLTLPDGSQQTYYRNCALPASGVDTRMKLCTWTGVETDSCTYKYATTECGKEQWFTGAGCTGSFGGLDTCHKPTC